MEICVNNNETDVELVIDGRIDSNTSIELQEQILAAIEGSNHVVLDFAKVSYISSAGLRSILIGQKAAAKKRGVMELANVSDIVMEVLQTVGFDKILTFK